MTETSHHYRTVGVCLPPVLRDQLEDAASKAGLPLSTYARLALVKHLEAEKVAA